jgi:hypothetical protein
MSMVLVPQQERYFDLEYNTISYLDFAWFLDGGKLEMKVIFWREELEAW